MLCHYCGQQNGDHANTCRMCGATLRKLSAEQDGQHGDDDRFVPSRGFAYMGHWVIVERTSFGEGDEKWYWYLGPELMAIVPISIRLLHEMFPELRNSLITDEGNKVLKFMYELYLVAVGDQREYVIKWAAHNVGIREVSYVVTKRVGEIDANRQFSYGLSYGQLIMLRDKANGASL